MDPENAVVALCAEGMATGDDALFLRAWEVAADDWERCVAAHYVALSRPEAAQRLRWNRRCLELADAVGDARVAGFYPSLHASLGRAWEDLGEVAAAREEFERAAGRAGVLGEDAYGASLREAIAEGLRRTGGVGPRGWAGVR
ncbi:hypothetical protein [Streptomyces carpaticus]|uniref:hypothetical protein n=1 Tax=Streptomyces carpaticus TaxID=285558 RepID=UPI0031F84C88